jgi:ABC-type phosphate transport system substrate-binding protein
LIKGLLIAAFLLPLLSTYVFGDAEIIFIINKKNPTEVVETRDIIDYYRKEKRQWPDGMPVRFVDHSAGSEERRLFLRKILKQSSTDVDLYWFSQKLRSGDSMPMQVSSDSMVIQFVKSIDGAIGYVSSSVDLAEGGVKQLKVSDTPKN